LKARLRFAGAGFHVVVSDSLRSNPGFTFTGAELRHGRVVAKKGWFHGGCPILSEE